MADYLVCSSLYPSASHVMSLRPEFVTARLFADGCGCKKKMYNLTIWFMLHGFHYVEPLELRNTFIKVGPGLKKPWNAPFSD